MVAIRGTFLTYLVQYTQNISLVDMGGGGEGGGVLLEAGQR